MPELLSHITNIILPIVLCVSVGYTLARWNLPFDRKIIGSLVQNIGYPALIISHLSAGHVQLGAFLHMAAAAATMLLVFVVCAGVFLALVGLPLRAFIAPMSLNNVGNIGLPVATLAYGDAGLSYALAFVVVVLLGVFTYGNWVPSGTVSIRKLITSPVIYAIIIALTLLGLDLDLPKPLAAATDTLGGMAIPLMLLTLGHTLATLNLASLHRGAMLAGFHLIMACSTAFGLAALFGFAGTERGVFILMCLMPVSVATYLFVELYAEDYASDAAALILISTLATLLVLPIALAFGI